MIWTIVEWASTSLLCFNFLLLYVFGTQILLHASTYRQRSNTLTSLGSLLVLISFILLDIFCNFPLHIHWKNVQISFVIILHRWHHHPKQPPIHHIRSECLDQLWHRLMVCTAVWICENSWRSLCLWIIKQYQSATCGAVYLLFIVPAEETFKLQQHFHLCKDLPSKAFKKQLHNISCTTVSFRNSISSFFSKKTIWILWTRCLQLPTAPRVERFILKS